MASGSEAEQGVDLQVAGRQLQLGPEPIHRQARQDGVAVLGRDVQQHGLAGRRDEDVVEQPPLRGQQAREAQFAGLDRLGQQVVEEAHGVGARGGTMTARLRSGAMLGFVMPPMWQD